MNLHTAFVVMGVSGAGKTSISRALSECLPATYVEADDYHSSENIRTMTAGSPLTDAMRIPWLESVGDAVEIARKNGNVVVACSALKRTYRDLLCDHIVRPRFIFLSGDRETIAERMRLRSDHFMSASLLDNQFETLEPPAPDERAIIVDISASEKQVLKYVEQEVRATMPESPKLN